MTRSRTGDERELLAAFLDQQRDAVVWKLDGLDEDKARQRMRRDGLHLLGLAKHLAAAEWYWLSEVFGRPAEPQPLSATDDAELEPDDTIDSVLGYYARARAASDEAMGEVDLDATATTWLGDVVSFRWAILHVIEETARHAGHADLIREHIDGTTGHLPDDIPY